MPDDVLEIILGSPHRVTRGHTTRVAVWLRAAITEHGGADPGQALHDGIVSAEWPETDQWGFPLERVTGEAHETDRT